MAAISVPPPDQAPPEVAAEPVPPEAPPAEAPPAQEPAGGQAPPYMGFLQMFKREYADAPPEVVRTAEHVWEAFDKYMSKSDGGGWHELAQTFSYADYLHDVVLAVAVRHGDTEELESEKKPKEPKKESSGRTA